MKSIEVRLELKTHFHGANDQDQRNQNGHAEIEHNDAFDDR